MTSRREAPAAFLAALTAGVLLLVAVAQRWASGHANTQQALIVVSKHVSGRTAAPVVAAAGVVALAAAASIPATRGRGRQIVGAIVTLVGGAAASESLLRRITAQRDLRHALPAGATVSATGWPYVALVGSVLLVGVGLVMALRGARWPSLSSRYEAAPSKRSVPAGDAGTWDALDRGEDPTTGDGG